MIKRDMIFNLLRLADMYFEDYKILWVVII